MAEEAKKDISGVNPWDVLIWKLDSMEKYFQRELGDLRREIVDLRQEIRGEAKETRRSYLVLQWTAVLGFLAVIAAVLVPKFL